MKQDKICMFCLVMCIICIFIVFIIGQMKVNNTEKSLNETIHNQAEQLAECKTNRIKETKIINGIKYNCVVVISNTTYPDHEHFDKTISLNKLNTETNQITNNNNYWLLCDKPKKWIWW